MIVFQTDIDGVFVGKVHADPSPLEPGVFLIPAGCVQTPPPALVGAQFAQWDGQDWRVQTPPAPAEPLPPTTDQARAAASLAKIDFCRALYRAQILPADLVVDAALGQWPAPFAAAIAHLSEAEQVDAKLAWAGAATVTRMAPLFLSLLDFYARAQRMSQTEAQDFGDQIFGIET